MCGGEGGGVTGRVLECAEKTSALIHIKSQTLKDIHLQSGAKFSFKVAPVLDFDVPVTNDHQERGGKCPRWLEPEVIKRLINKQREFAYWKAVCFGPATAHFQLDGEPSFLGKVPGPWAHESPAWTHRQLSCNGIGPSVSSSKSSHTHVRPRRTQTHWRFSP